MIDELTVPTVMVDDVYRAFLTCGLWADLVEFGEDGESWNSDRTDVEIDDVIGSGDAWSIVHDFLTTVHGYAQEHPVGARAWQYLYDNRDQAGHDLWLTANHHGAGFWDRGLGDVGDYLTSVAHGIDELILVVQSDGEVVFGL